MRGFSEWLDLNESFKLPFRVIKDIYNYTKRGYVNRVLSPNTVIRPKHFKLNLRGTRYEFLNKYNPEVLINYLEIPDDTRAYYKGMETREIELPSDDPLHKRNFEIRSTGRIEIGLNNSWMEMAGTIEHEVLHFIQDLIKQHQKDTSYKNKKKKNLEPMPGGLPRIPMVKSIMRNNNISVNGWDRDTGGYTKHHFQPIEFMTNLVSYIDEIKNSYMVRKYEQGANNLERLERVAKDIEAKKKYFKDILSSDNDIIKRLKELRDLNNELGEKYLQEIYKNFVIDNSWWEDWIRSNSDANEIIENE
jgi:hypothetical protein